MFCNNCGAAVTGKFCSACGKKVRTPLAEFRLQEKHRKKAFLSEVYQASDLSHEQLANACWIAADIKCLTHVAVNGRIGEIYPDAYINLQKAEILARKLYHALIYLIEMS